MSSKCRPNQKVINALKKLSKETKDEKKSALDEIKKDSIKVLNELSKEGDDFEKSRIKEMINDYATNHKRLLYSEITAYLLDLENKNDKENIKTRMFSNADSMLEDYLSEDKQVQNDSTKIFMKLWDHINLANNQIQNLKMTDEVIAKKFTEQAKPLLDEISTVEEDLNDSKKDLYSQLITIVSIFTAISFVMFGGMTLLNNLFDYKEMTSVPLTEMICCGSLIGIVTISILYLFVVLILFITNKLNKGDKWPYIGPFVYSVSILAIIFTVTFSKWMGIL